MHQTEASDTKPHTKPSYASEVLLDYFYGYFRTTFIGGFWSITVISMN